SHEAYIEKSSGENASTYSQKALVADINFLAPAVRDEVLRRLAYVQEIRLQHLTSRTEKTLNKITKLVAKRLEDPHQPSWIPLYRWERAYTRSGDDIRSLVPRYHDRGPQGPMIDSDANEALEKIIKAVYLKDPTCNGEEVYSLVELKIFNDN